MVNLRLTTSLTFSRVDSGDGTCVSALDDVGLDVGGNDVGFGDSVGGLVDVVGCGDVVGSAVGENVVGSGVGRLVDGLRVGRRAGLGVVGAGFGCAVGRSVAADGAGDGATGARVNAPEERGVGFGVVSLGGAVVGSPVTGVGVGSPEAVAAVRVGMRDGASLGMNDGAFKDEG
jgi:hypothetical protein